MPRKARTVPWIEWRGGVAYACWYDREARRTKRLSLGQRDPGTAQAAFAEFLAKGVDVYKPKEATNDLKVAQALEYYYQERRRAKVSGPVFKNMQAHLVRHLGHLAVKDIDVPTCTEYTRVRRLEGAADGSIRNELGVIATAAKHCVKHKHLAATDLPQVELPEVSEPRSRWLRHEELQALRAAADPQTRDFIDLAYWTASRKTAIFTLTKFQVKLAENRINLAKQGERKTKKRRPIIPIVPELRPVVERLMRETPGELMLPEKDYNWGFEKACKACGFNDVTPHTLRHTRITHMLQAGIEPWVVAGYAGLTIDTLINVYGHHCPAFMAQVLALRKQGDESGA
jgi:integrase